MTRSLALAEFPFARIATPQRSELHRSSLMSWREQLLIDVGGGYLPGVTLGPWLRLLGQSGVELRPRFCLRAACITGYAIQNTIFSWYESARFSSQIEGAEIAPPIFILGAPRQGTTHLHNLLSIDSGLASPNFYQVLYPRTFLTTEKAASTLLGFLLPEKRPLDNVRQSFSVPHEEEIAVASAGALSPYLGFVFPKDGDRYRGYLDPLSLSESDLEEWKNYYLWFLKKVSLRYGKRLVLKSPLNTSRVSLLLSLFPSAKFVHIARHPFDVYRSSVQAIRIVHEWVGLQSGENVDWDQEVLSGHRRIYDRYFQERSLIPDGALHELTFEQLEKDPVGEIARIYEELQLGDFAHIEENLSAYLNSISGYQKNEPTPLDASTKQRIIAEWGRDFEEWGYTT